MPDTVMPLFKDIEKGSFHLPTRARQVFVMGGGEG